MTSETEDFFPEIARIENDNLEIKAEALDDVFSSQELSNCRISIHVIINPDANYNSSLLTKHLINEFINSWPTLNAHHTATNFAELVSNTSGKQLVIYKRPVLTLSNDGRKTNIANFFINVNNKDQTDYTILAAVAAFLASSVPGKQEGIKTKGFHWECHKSIGISFQRETKLYYQNKAFGRTIAFPMVEYLL